MNWLVALRMTFASVVRDRGILAFFVLGVPAYSFFYPLPYSTEAVRHVPLEIVDRDASPLSRQAALDLAANPSVQYQGQARSLLDASQRLADGTIAGVVVIPENFQRDVLRGRTTAVTAYGTGAYPVQDKATLGSVGEIVLGIAGRAGVERLIREGAPPAGVLQAVAAGPVYEEQPLYNLTRGYGAYVVTIACFGIVLGTWFANRERALQVLLATSVPFLFMCGAIFPREAIPAPINALAALVPTTPAINGLLKLNEIGARWPEVRAEFVNTLALLVLYGGFAWVAIVLRRGQLERGRRGR